MTVLDTFKKDVCLEKFSTMKLASTAALFKEVTTAKEAQDVFCAVSEQSLPYWVLGKGSNTLLPSRVEGVVLLNKIGGFEQNNNQFKVGAGLAFPWLAQKVAKLGYGGLEFAIGIPGSVGGAIFMNAGASGSETANALKKVGFVHASGRFEELDISQCQMAYRSSIFKRLDGMIVYGVFELAKDEQALNRQKQLFEKRLSTQPYKSKTLGCFFKNPPGTAAGKLVDELGLKGLQVGSAMVSTLHGNFLTNTGDASAQEVLELAARVKQKVKEAKGIDLELEVTIAHPHRIKEEKE